MDRKSRLDKEYRPENSQVCNTLRSTALESRLSLMGRHILQGTVYNLVVLPCCTYHLHIQSLYLMLCWDSDTLADTWCNTFVIQLSILLGNRLQFGWYLCMDKPLPQDTEYKLFDYPLSRIPVDI